MFQSGDRCVYENRLCTFLGKHDNLNSVGYIEVNQPPISKQHPFLGLEKPVARICVFVEDLKPVSNCSDPKEV